MKIQETLRVNVPDRKLKSEKNMGNQGDFQRIFSSYSKDLTEEKLQQLLKDIDQQGQSLSDNPNFTELRKYKNLVKQFMSEVSNNGLGIYQTDTWDPQGGSKTIKTVQTIDRKLIELTDHVLNQQQNGLSILDRIGEIKGLLINLYS